MSDITNSDEVELSVDPEHNALSSLPDLYDVGYSISIGFLVLASTLVLVMQFGRALIENGVSKAKIESFTIYKNLLCFSVCVLTYWFVGFGTAFSEENGANSFIGVGGIMLLNIKRTFVFFVQLSYALSANFIWNSSVSGRMRLGGYVYYTILLSAFVYPVVTHWAWNPIGWLSRWGPVGVIDFAGASIVHVFAGSATLILIKLLGPRWHFDSSHASYTLSHKSNSTALGVLTTWVGWVLFHTISSAMVPPAYQTEVIGRAVSTTFLASTASVLTTSTLRSIVRPSSPTPSSLHLAFSCVAGAVAVSACAASVDLWVAVIIGAAGGLVYFFTSATFRHMRIDDAGDTVAIHLAVGAWSLLAAGLFSNPALLEQVRGELTFGHHGIFYGGAVRQLWIQCVTILVVPAWTIGCIVLLYLPYRYFLPLRTDMVIEKKRTLLALQDEFLQNPMSWQDAVRFTPDGDDGPIVHDGIVVPMQVLLPFFNKDKFHSLARAIQGEQPPSEGGVSDADATSIETVDGSGLPPRKRRQMVPGATDTHSVPGHTSSNQAPFDGEGEMYSITMPLKRQHSASDEVNTDLILPRDIPLGEEILPAIAPGTAPSSNPTASADTVTGSSSVFGGRLARSMRVPQRLRPPRLGLRRKLHPSTQPGTGATSAPSSSPSNTPPVPSFSTFVPWSSTPLSRQASAVSSSVQTPFWGRRLPSLVSWFRPPVSAPEASADFDSIPPSTGAELDPASVTTHPSAGHVPSMSPSISPPTLPPAAAFQESYTFPPLGEEQEDMPTLPGERSLTIRNPLQEEPLSDPMITSLPIPSTGRNSEVSSVASSSRSGTPPPDVTGAEGYFPSSSLSDRIVSSPTAYHMDHPLFEWSSGLMDVHPSTSMPVSPPTGVHASGPEQPPEPQSQSQPQPQMQQQAQQQAQPTSTSNGHEWLGSGHVHPAPGNGSFAISSPHAYPPAEVYMQHPTHEGMESPLVAPHLVPVSDSPLISQPHPPHPHHAPSTFYLPGNYPPFASEAPAANTLSAFFDGPGPVSTPSTVPTAAAAGATVPMTGNQITIATTGVLDEPPSLPSLPSHINIAGACDAHTGQDTEASDGHVDDACAGSEDDMDINMAVHMRLDPVSDTLGLSQAMTSASLESDGQATPAASANFRPVGGSVSNDQTSWGMASLPASQGECLTYWEVTPEEEEAIRKALSTEVEYPYSRETIAGPSVSEMHHPSGVGDLGAPDDVLLPASATQSLNVRLLPTSGMDIASLATTTSVQSPTDIPDATDRAKGKYPRTDMYSVPQLDSIDTLPTLPSVPSKPQEDPEDDEGVSIISHLDLSVDSSKESTSSLPVLAEYSAGLVEYDSDEPFPRA